MATAEKKRPRVSSGAGKRPNRKEWGLPDFIGVLDSAANVRQRHTKLETAAGYWIPTQDTFATVLERKKAIDELIRKAIAVKDHLVQFPDFHKFQRNGLSVYLESGRGDQLTLPVKKYIQNLLKVNMEGPYGLEWPSEEKVKRQEMVAPEARYIFVKQYSNGFTTECSMNQDAGVKHTHTACSEGCLVGFVHYRFVLEEELPVVYVYELQMEPSSQGKGLGKFMMQLIEQIACKNQMGAVMLTVQKANTQAMSFYTKLRYVISSTSPSRVDPQIGLEKSYEILCKTFDSEAKSKLEDGDEEL